MLDLSLPRRSAWSRQMRTRAVPPAVRGGKTPPPRSTAGTSGRQGGVVACRHSTPRLARPNERR
eukprot:scaffold179812_cov38-Prasinocladus_malaysianus.AAC.1